MNRRRTYRRRRRINIKRIAFIVLFIVVAAVLGIKLFSSVSYQKQMSEVLSSDIQKTTGSISRISSVDTGVYSNDGITYTNRHGSILRIKSFDSSVQEEAETAKKAEKLLEKTSKLENSQAADDIPTKQDGYYWIEINAASGKDEYSFDIYYNISESKIYIKDKYYDKFSKKNNKAKLLSYDADDEYRSMVEELAGVEAGPQDNTEQ